MIKKMRMETGKRLARSLAAGTVGLACIVGLACAVGAPAMAQDDRMTPIAVPAQPGAIEASRYRIYGELFDELSQRRYP